METSFHFLLQGFMPCCKYGCLQLGISAYWGQYKMQIHFNDTKINSKNLSCPQTFQDSLLVLVDEAL